MFDLSEKLRLLTVEITCNYCKAIYSVKLTGFGGLYICECNNAIKTSDSDKITICKADNPRAH